MWQRFRNSLPHLLHGLPFLGVEIFIEPVGIDNLRTHLCLTKSILPFQYGDIGKLVHSLAGVLDISALVDNALLFEVPTPSSERGNLDYDKIVGILFVNHRVLGKAPQILDRMNVG